MKNIVFNILIILMGFSIKGQEVKKDTLYFKFDKNYFQIYDVTPDQYYLIDSNDDGPFFFQKMETFTDLKPKKILCLKKYVRKSNYYDKSRYRKLDDFGLSKSFKSYIIFLVRKEGKTKKYIKVYPLTEIE